MNAPGEDVVVVRPLHEGDLAIVKGIGKRALSPPMGLLMSATLSAQGLVAETRAGNILGAIVLRVISLRGRRLGIIDWAVVEPEAQGQGIGSLLGSRALTWFSEKRCDCVLTTDVDGYNSAAWSTAYAGGLRYWPLREQIREFGRHWLKLMIVIPHVGVTTFILRSMPAEARQSKATPGNDLRSLVGVTLFLCLLLPLSRVREVLWESTAIPDLLAPVSPAAILAGALVTTLFVGARATSHWLTARSSGLPTCFRPWGSGIFLASLVAILFGGLLPGFTGSVYARDERFDYDKSERTIGLLMLAGIGASLALFAMFTVWGELAPGLFPTLGKHVGIAFGITDTLLFFSPFQALPAGRLWRWRRDAWFVALACFVGIWFLVPLTF